MQRVTVIIGILVLVLSLPTFANAQVPDLLPIPVGLQGQPREELAARRSQLESQWYALVLKVNDHNRKCGKVPANTPLANQCRENMKSLQGQIAAHIEAVNGFNQAVQRQTTIDRIEVPPPRVPSQEACAEEAGCLLDAGVEKAMGWMQERYWDVRVWANDPMHRQWLGDAWDIFMTGIGAVRGSSAVAAEVGRIGQLTAAEDAALLGVFRKHGIPFRIMGSKAEVARGLEIRADPMLREFLPLFRSKKWQSTGKDLDVLVNPRTVKKLGWKKTLALARDIREVFTGKYSGKTGLEVDLVGYSKRYLKDMDELPSISYGPHGRSQTLGWGNWGNPLWEPKPSSEVGVYPKWN